MGTISTLSDEVITSIKKLIEEKRSEENLRREFPNPLLREDVLDLLDKYCTVIYYPLENEDNNGFHITGIPDCRGEERHFVFINTAQTTEKQVFTAAHELGHIWKVDDYVHTQCNLALTDLLREQIINRFAAELLIPEKEFVPVFQLELKKQTNQDGQITIANMLKVIVALMYHFFVPMKAIVYRCFELNLFSRKNVDLLLGDGALSKNIIESKVNEIIRSSGYIKFQTASHKKWISGLAELLDRAEALGAVSNSKIKKMRQDFSLSQTSSDVQMNEIVEMKTTEGC